MSIDNAWGALRSPIVVYHPTYGDRSPKGKARAVPVETAGALRGFLDTSKPTGYAEESGYTKRGKGALLSVLAETGVAQGAAACFVPTALGTLLGVLAPAQAFARAVPEAGGTLVAAIGAVRARGFAATDDWGANGFPLPKIAGYSFKSSSGLHRTAMVSGVTRQRRRWTNGFRTATLSFTVLHSQLYALEAFIDTQGYDWFSARLVTKDSPDGSATAHYIRIAADPQFSGIYGDTIAVTLDVEIMEPT